MRAIRERLTYANVMATVAVFIALGGSAWAVAANSVGPKQIKKNAVRAKHVKKNQIRAKHIKKNQVRTKQIKDGAVKAKDINAEQVQLRVDGSCPADWAIRVINIDGDILCEVDDEGGPPSGPAGGDLTGSYPSPVIANGAVTHAKLSTDASPRWGVFNNAGALTRGRGVVDSEQISTAVYEVTFDRDVSACAWSATVARSAAAEPKSGEIGLRSPVDNPNGVVVHTWDDDGLPSINRFHLLVTC